MLTPDKILLALKNDRLIKRVARVSLTPDGRLRFTSNRRLVLILPIDYAFVLGFEDRASPLDENTCFIELYDTAPDPSTSELRFVPLPEAYYHRKERTAMEIAMVKEEQRYAVETVVPINMDLVQPQNLMLYADCIRPSLVGNAYGQFLTTIPILKQQDFFSEYVPQCGKYHALTSTTVDRVQFQLLQTDGSRTQPTIQYRDKLKSYRTYLTLSFRRKKSDC